MSTDTVSVTVQRSRPWVRSLSANGILLFLVLMIIVFSIALPETFFTWSNSKAILANQAIPIILAIAAVLPLSAGEFDLSIGAVMGFSALTCITLINAGVPMVAAVAACIVVGLAIGGVNAYFVVVLKVNAFITTLGMATILAGLNVVLTNSSLLVLNDDGFKLFTRFELVGLQVVVLYAVIVSVVAYLLLERTPYGRYLTATGMGRPAARLSGVRVDRYLASSFILAAGIAAIAGVLMASRGGTGSPTLGPEYLLPAYAAAFLGATSVRPGYFNVWGTVIGAFLLAVGSNGLILMGAASWVTNIFNGVALLVAVAFSGLVARRRARTG